MPGPYKMEPNVEDHIGLPDKPFKESDLLKALESIHKKASFASMTRINTLNPYIFVQDVGMIDNPLSETQAKQIAAKSHQAPYENSNETIVDTPVPNIWELNPDQFKIRAPAWQTYLNKALVYVARKLNITSPISAELHKMLLYEQGAMSKTAPDTEKIPGVFGTLVINLPSHHEGGDVVVNYRGASKLLPTSRHDMACAFWFSDASYEVLPVKSGYNWVLVYKLAIDPTAALPTAASRLENKALRAALESWSQEVSNGSRKPLPLCYAFDVNYTDYCGGVSYQGLKEADRERVRCLRTMCTDLDFDVFLATLEKKETRIIEDRRRPDWDMGCYCDHDDEEEEEQEDVDCDTTDEFCDVSYMLTGMVDVEGRVLASNLKLDEECILQENSVTGTPWDEKYEGYVGLAGPQQTSRYLTSIPKDDIRAVYERIALAAINKLELDALTAAEIPSDIGVNGSRNTSGPQYVTYKSFLRFISTLVELKLQKHLTLLAQKIVAQADRVKGEELDLFWIPLLHGLFIVFEKRRVLLSVPYWMQIYQSFFKAYVMNYVLEQPAPPCSCHDCKWSLGAQFEAAMNVWWTRRLHAEFLFETFDQEMLRTVLGDQYDDIMSMKMLKRQQPQPVVCSTKQAHLQQIELMHATSRARNPNSSLTTSNLYNMPPRPPVTLSTAVAAGSARPAPRPRPTPKRSMLDVSRSISESARKRTAQNRSSPSTRRDHGVSSPVGGGSSSTPSRPTQRIPNPITGEKHKYIDVIDLTGDD
ncbi:putative 2og-fe oxygenase superfamily protein [Daldinia childiae]|uniref:putative 2og-fe oxygenase superfamily protein n=1 Tax=Daldinia childiae TaxID=326645 RepID=UPI0014481FD9|nr:putative 2og-fe oxygenase superfamily protein [Daldinia childiae]KAF3055737.1 putative 2og-fe oxygenase superfamily protein [Daldinia childiae]